MKKEILIACICIILILITPFTVVAEENKITSNIVEEPDVDGLVDQIRFVINEILQNYGHLPIIKSLCNMILNTMNLLQRILYCILLYVLFVPIAMLMVFFLSVGWTWGIGYFMIMFAFGLAMIIDSECTRYFSLKSFPIITELKEKSNVVSECPCMQE